MFQITGDGFREDLIAGELKGEAIAAKEKLERVIRENLSGPISAQAEIEVDAFGNPLP